MRTQLRVNRDLAYRSRMGLWAYSVFWPLIAVETQFIFENPMGFWLLEAVLVFLAGVRFLQNVKIGRTSKINHHRWRLNFRILTVIPMLIWGLVFAFSVFHDNIALFILMIISGSGLAAGGAINFSPDKPLAIAFAVAGLLPASIALVANSQTIYFIFVLLFLIYLIMMILNQHRQYWRSLENEKELDKQKLVLERLSQTDTLTKLFNRRYFDQKFDEYISICQRDKGYFSLLLIDIDKFKSINDTYGHDYGDRCLQWLADKLFDSITRSTDVVARYGGEEFALLLFSTDKVGANQIAEAIRLSVCEETFRYKNETIEVSISIGVTTFDSDNRVSTSSLFKQADEALYRAKNTGRNRVCVASEAIQQQAQ